MKYKYSKGQSLIVSIPKSTKQCTYVDGVYILQNMIIKNGETLVVVTKPHDFPYPTYYMSDGFNYPESFLRTSQIQFK